METMVQTRPPAKSERDGEVAKHWIGGQWLDAAEHRESINPATGEVIGSYVNGGRKEASWPNNRLRLEGGPNMLAAAQAAGVRRYLRQSIAFWAVPGRGSADEATPLEWIVSRAS